MKINPNLVDIYKKDTIEKSIEQQNCIRWFDSYRVNPLLSYFSIDDINTIHRLAMSPSMYCNVLEEYRLIGEIMNKRGFKLIGGGTNRRTYECVYDNRIVAKVATDPVGFTSNLRELVNQNVLKPFCCKIFEVSPCGTIAIIEKVVPLKDESEFKKYSSEIFNMLFFIIRNNSIAMEDIGTRSFKNYGYRCNFGPVFLDYPTMYVADPEKRLCRNIVNNRMCCGTLDYDEGFNVIVCSECGRTHFAKTLAKKQGDNITSLLQAVGYQRKDNNKGVKAMKIKIVNSKGEIEMEKSIGGESCYIDPTTSVAMTKPSDLKNKVKKHKRIGRIVSIDRNNDNVNNNIDTSSDNNISEEITNICVNSEKRKNGLNKLMNEYQKNIINQVNLYSPVSSDNILSELRNAFLKDTWKTNEFESNGLYKEISMATMIGDCYIDDSNITKADTSINRLLKSIIPDTDDLFKVFHIIVNTIKNTKDFFMCIISYWKTMIEVMSFDESGDHENRICCIYEEIYDVYHNAVNKAFSDYLINIRFNNNLVYNKSNIRNILTLSISEMNAIGTDEMGILDPKNYVTFVLGKDRCEQTIINEVVENTTIKEEVVSDNSIIDKETDDITVEEKIVSNDKEEEVIVSDNDITDKETSDTTIEEEVVDDKENKLNSYNQNINNKPMSRKQQYKYSNKKKCRKQQNQFNNDKL